MRNDAGLGGSFPVKAAIYEVQITACTFCDRETEHEILHVHEGVVRKEISQADYQDAIVYHYFTRCTRCNELSLYTDWTGSPVTGDLSKARLIYPNEDRYHDYIQKELSDDLREARKVKRISPIAYAVLMRRALEFLCKDQNAKGRNLHEKLIYLFNQKKIPNYLRKTSHILDEFGNTGANTGERVSDEYLETMDDFVCLLIDYLYVAPKKVENILSVMDKKGQLSP